VYSRRTFGPASSRILRGILVAAYQERCADSCVFEASVSPLEPLARTDSRDTDKTHLKSSTSQNEMDEKHAHLVALAAYEAGVPGTVA
jgi:hypothetical protein